MKVSEYYLRNELFKKFLQDQIQLYQKNLNRWIWFNNVNDFILDSTTGYLWPNLNVNGLNSSILNNFQKIKWGGTSGWRLPTNDEVVTMINDRTFPFYTDNGGYHHILNIRAIKTSDNVGIWLDSDYPNSVSSEGYILPCNSMFSHADAKEPSKRVNWFLNLCLKQDWIPNLSNNSDLERQYRILILVNRLKTNQFNTKVISKEDLLDLSLILEKGLLESDHYRANHQVWEYNQLIDPNRGMWELFPFPDPKDSQWTKVELKTPLEARNPERDIRIGSVAIDFGTSSTTVAYKEHGQIHLLRVGIADFFKEAQVGHYENPTILEFNNLPALLIPWRHQAYRPLTHWGDVSCNPPD